MISTIGRNSIMYITLMTLINVEKKVHEKFAYKKIATH